MHRFKYLIVLLALIGSQSIMVKAVFATDSSELTALEEKIKTQRAIVTKTMTNLHKQKERSIFLQGEINRLQAQGKQLEGAQKKALKTLQNKNSFIETSPELSNQVERLAYIDAKDKLAESDRQLADTRSSLATSQRDERVANVNLRSAKDLVHSLEEQIAQVRMRILRAQVERTQIVVVEGESGCDNQSVKKCMSLALEEAKRQAAEQGSSVLVDSVTLVNEGIMEKDEIVSQVSAVILNFEILEKGWSSDHSYRYKIKATVKGRFIQKPFASKPRQGNDKREGSSTATTHHPRSTPHSYTANNEGQPKASSNSQRKVDMEFVTIPTGCFFMGNSKGNSNEGPTHEVCIDSFQIGKYEVTQEQWQSVMNNNPSHFNSSRTLPVEQVSWLSIKMFLNKINGNGAEKYRLPTEAEWEYACRGGMSGFADGTKSVGESAWYTKNGENRTHPVGTKAPNGYGLHDMGGNVWEWVQDAYDPTGYKRHEARNPVVTSRSLEHPRVNRGGDATSTSWALRCSNRDSNKPNTKYRFIGFRLAREL